MQTGGVLLCAMCTNEPEEHEDVITDFLAGRGEEFVIDPRPSLPGPAGAHVDEQGFFHPYPAAFEMDGFCGVRMVNR